MGLNEFYSAIRGKILWKNSLLDVTMAYSFIVQEEKQWSFRWCTWENINCNDDGTRKYQHWEFSRVILPTPTHVIAKYYVLLYCDQDHHVRERYWKLNGYPLEHPKQKPIKSEIFLKTTTPFIPWLISLQLLIWRTFQLCKKCN
jgi:hypothetical protein